MHLPAARQLGLAARFLHTLPWNGFEPQAIAQDRLESFLQKRPRLRRVALKLGWRPAPPAPVAVGLARDRSVAIAYTVSDQAFRMDLSSLRGPVQATWIDPTNFDALPVRPFTQGSRVRVVPPGRNADGDGDWLLLLRSVSNLKKP